MWLMSRVLHEVPCDSRTPVITARTVVINPRCRECCVSVTKEPATEKRTGERGDPGKHRAMVEQLWAHHRVKHRRCHFHDVECRGKPSYTTSVEVIKGYADLRQLLGRSELYGEEREVPSASVCYKNENKRDQLTVPDGRYRTYCHIRIPVWRAVRIPDHNNVKWKTFTVVLG
ncbi:hypothetical protein G5I_12911 [Acromyrmex echinatior]|uniref:Uncharacterized protein n=1 Tax=Acromyrmex echinatior TaxID=103372 RepID=F4X408_ACREC|nr:hypothetical protein G5I_12911 [Acromyrmex echinatior]